MEIHVLNEQNSVGNLFLYELRDVGCQSDRQRFRQNLEKLGELMAYEFSKTLQTRAVKAVTPLDEVDIDIPVNDLVLVTVLRAGIPFYQGFLNVFREADSGFIGAFREEGTAKDLEVRLNYSAIPNLTDKQLVLIDPMLATGKSLAKSFVQCKKHGHPKAVHFMSVISTPEGIERLKEDVDHPGSIWTWAIDSHLNNQAYIVPGLGDAGDLAFGPKE